MTFAQKWRYFVRLQLSTALRAGEETALIGGQAVMEGVMMRSPSSYCVAVRLPNTAITTDCHRIEPMRQKYPWARWPVARGLAVLGSAMALGTRALQFSARCAAGEVDAAEGKHSEAGKGVAAALFVSLLFTIAVYKVAPLFLATFIGRHVPALGGRVAVNLIDGLIRIGIFLGFMYGLSRTKDMYRLFQYHGAEHKVVFNFESGLPLSVANAQRFTTYHPRCGTSFLVVVLILSLFIYAFLPFDHFWSKLLARVLMLPLVVGLSYEAIRFAAKGKSTLMAILTRPGLWLQRVTTKPPTDDQVQVAIVALEHALQLEKEQDGVLMIA